MAKEKVTLTLDAGNLSQLRALVGNRSLSAGMDEALSDRLARLRHQAAVDAWLEGLETADGAVSPTALAHAEEAFAQLDEKPADDPARRAG